MKNSSRTKNPKSSTLESTSSNRTTVRAATVTIVVLHVAFLLGIFSQGCKKENYPGEEDSGKGTQLTSNGNGSGWNLGDHGADLPGVIQDDNGGAQNGLESATNNPSYSAIGSEETGDENVGAPRLSDVVIPDDNNEGAGSGNDTNLVDNIISSDPNNNSGGGLSMEVSNPIEGHPGTHSSGSSDQGNTSGNNSQHTASSSPGAGSTASGNATIIDVTINKGDTIGSIARKNKTTVQEIVKLNPEKLKDLKKVQIGWVIKVPAQSSSSSQAATSEANASQSNTNGSANGSASSTSKTYTVKKGDSLFRIAKQFGVSWKDIQKANDMKSSAIFPGNKLIIPEKSSGSQ